MWRPEANTTGRKTIGVAITTTSYYGYIVICINKYLYMAHRLAWLHTYAAWPKDEIDHINCNRADNRISNLRQATRFENARNQPLRATNTSGLKGVSQHTETKKWTASITYNRKMTNLGLFDTPEAAHSAYAAEAKKLHKEFARLA